MSRLTGQENREPRLCECGADLDRNQDHNLDCRSRLSGRASRSVEDRIPLAAAMCSATALECHHDGGVSITGSQQSLPAACDSVSPEQRLSLLIDAYADAEPVHGYSSEDQFPLTMVDISNMVAADPDILLSVFYGPREEHERAANGLQRVLSRHLDDTDLHMLAGSIFLHMLRRTCQRELMHKVDAELLKRGAEDKGFIRSRS